VPVLHLMQRECSERSRVMYVLTQRWKCNILV
jgi:hypothetical protein